MVKKSDDMCIGLYTIGYHNVMDG